MRYDTLGIIGKFQPPTIGHHALLDEAANAANHLRIGIGSVNRYDAQRPFHPREVEDLLAIALRTTSTPYDVVRIPDYGHVTGNSDAWVEHMCRAFHGIDALVTGNPYVTELLAPHMRIVHPDAIIPPTQRVIASSTAVRHAIARHEAWQRYVQPDIAQYIIEHGIDERIRREFGNALRTMEAHTTITIENERQRILEATS